MLYNSFTFLLFFPIVALLYYIVPKQWKWLYIILVSYWFYANWNPTFVLLMVGITLVTYVGALIIEKTGLEQVSRRKTVLWLTLLLTILPLLLYKYLNFFATNIISLFDVCGISMDVPLPQWMLPIGISFYTFQAMGYVIDVYKEKKIGGNSLCERHLGRYAAFVCFFPQTAAGPIGRVSSLLPQLRNPQPIMAENLSKGLKWILWGYFMKVAVADRLSLYTDAVMGNVGLHNGSSVVLAAVLFSIQIYCDFGGYSLLAVGAGKVMGYDLIMNFQRPYMSQSVGEFWRRWHISLSTWFRDYVYFPLGGSRCSKLRTNINLMITFLVSGLWHGSAWTFVFWGGINGLFQIIERPFMTKTKNKENTKGIFCQNNKFIDVRKWLKIALTFTLMTVAWVFFKANTFQDAWLALTKMLIPLGKLYNPGMSTMAYCLIGALLVVVEDIWHEKIGKHPLFDSPRNNVYYCLRSV